MNSTGMGATIDPPDTATPERNDFLGFELVTGHQPAEGSEYAIQTLYEGKPKCTCCKNWVDTYPEDLLAQVEDQPETKQKAIVVRMRRNHAAENAERGKSLVLDSVVVQSESLKSTLGEVFDGYRGITASLKRLVFKAPFHPFHYRWQRFGKILERQKGEDPVAAGYSQILYDLLRSELDYVMSEIQDMTEHGVVTYAKLWSLFEPGELVIATNTLQQQICIVESSEYKHNNSDSHVIIKAKYIDWNGEMLGYSSKEFRIDRFSGTRSIAELELCPVTLHPDGEDIANKAVDRGRRFRELCGIHHKAYSGEIWYKSTRGKEVIGKVNHLIPSLVWPMPLLTKLG